MNDDEPYFVEYPEPLEDWEKDAMQAGLPPKEVDITEGDYEYLEERMDEKVFHMVLNRIREWFDKYMELKYDR